ncbi:hypothetical protein Bbelb_392760 [Branchiostoma belcheri]|nr:hypothetical protein Bbelb_392760 [Branchiostoma belcheri]
MEHADKGLLLQVKKGGPPRVKGHPASKALTAIVLKYLNPHSDHKVYSHILEKIIHLRNLQKARNRAAIRGLKFMPVATRRYKVHGGCEARPRSDEQSARPSKKGGQPGAEHTLTTRCPASPFSSAFPVAVPRLAGAMFQPQEF